MQIEILIGNKEPLYYSFTKPQLLVGAESAADVVVREEGISRKHVIISQEGDRYFVTDQGSTNGTFLNEEKLTPGEKVEFTSYFPLRLAHSVMISLVEGQDDTKFSFNTQSISKAPLTGNQKTERTGTHFIKTGKHNTQTSALLRRHGEVSAKRTKVKKSSFIWSWKTSITLALIGGAAFYHFKQSSEPTTDSQGVSRELPAPSAATAPAKVLEVPKIPTAVSPGTIVELNPTKKKCESVSEQLLCASVKGAENPWGAFTHQKQVIMVLDGTAYYEQAKSLLPPPSEKTASYEKEIWELAMGFFFMEGFKDNAYEKLQEELVFAFFSLHQDFPELKVTLAIRPESLILVRRLMKRSKLDYVKVSRSKIMNFGAEFYEFKFLN